MLKGLGFEVIVYRPFWPRREPDGSLSPVGVEGVVPPGHSAFELVAETLLHARPGETIFIGGHSTGAAFAAEVGFFIDRIVRPEPPDVRLVLFSFSPFYENWIEEAHRTPKSDTIEMPPEFRDQLGERPIPEVLCPVQIYCGTREAALNRRMHQELRKRWPHAQSIEPDAGHNINVFPAYQNAARLNIPLLMPANPRAPDGLEEAYGPQVVLEGGQIFDRDAGLFIRGLGA